MPRPLYPSNYKSNTEALRHCVARSFISPVLLAAPVSLSTRAVCCLLRHCGAVALRAVSCVAYGTQLTGEVTCCPVSGARTPHASSHDHTIAPPWFSYCAAMRRHPSRVHAQLAAAAVRRLALHWCCRHRWPGLGRWGGAEGLVSVKVVRAVHDPQPAERKHEVELMVPYHRGAGLLCGKGGAEHRRHEPA